MGGVSRVVWCIRGFFERFDIVICKGTNPEMISVYVCKLLLPVRCLKLCLVVWSLA